MPLKIGQPTEGRHARVSGPQGSCTAASACCDARCSVWRNGHALRRVRGVCPCDSMRRRRGRLGAARACDQEYRAACARQFGTAMWATTRGLVLASFARGRSKWRTSTPLTWRPLREEAKRTWTTSESVVPFVTVAWAIETSRNLRSTSGRERFCSTSGTQARRDAVLRR